MQSNVPREAVMHQLYLVAAIFRTTHSYLKNSLRGSSLERDDGNGRKVQGVD